MARHRVLLVDDEEDLTESLVRRLSKALPEVEFVGETSGEAALRRLTERPFSIMVTDVRMPGINGVELILHARTMAPSMYCVIMTACATEQVRSEMSRHDWVTYIEKPFELEALKTMLEDLLEEPPPSRVKGAMELETLPDLLQLFVLAQTTGAVRVWHGEDEGAIWFDRGELTHAETGRNTGVAAFNEVVSWTEGEFAIDSGLVAPERTLFETPAALLKEAYRLIESQRSAPPVARREELSEASAPPPQRPKRQSTLEAMSWDDEPTAVSALPTTIKGASATLRAGDDPRVTPHETERTMSEIDEACREVIAKVDGAVACGVVDLSKGVLLGIYNAAQYNPSLNEAVAAATMDIFRGPNIHRIEQMVRAHRGVPESGEHYVQEIQMTSAHNYHFAKAIRGGTAAVMLVTEKTTNIGMGWAQLKAVIPSLERLVP